MQVLLKKSEDGDQRQDVKCAICGQGFHLYWERRSLEEQASARIQILAELLGHHHVDKSPAAHPAGPFTHPSWPGAAQFSGAALLGGLSTIRRVAPAEFDYSSSIR